MVSNIAATEWSWVWGRMGWKMAMAKGMSVCGSLEKHIVFEQMDHINYLLFRPNWWQTKVLLLCCWLLLILKAIKFCVVPISQVLQLIAEILKISSGCNNSFFETTILSTNRKMFSINTRLQSTFSLINSFDKMHPTPQLERWFLYQISVHPCRKWLIYKRLSFNYKM